MNINDIAEKQREYFYQSETISYQFRIREIKKLLSLVKKYEKSFSQALEKDLGKSYEQFYLSELSLFYQEAHETMKKLKSWMKPKKVKGNLASFPSRSYIHPSPYGSCLIISPWNYPFLLSFDPVLGSMAGGNCTVLKPSEFTPHFSETAENIINDNFSDNYLHVTTGGIDVGQNLLAQNFDYIFFTGSTNVGKIVMQAAAQNLTPVTLELGGKSPCVIDNTANLRLSAKRVAWGKFLNAGQSCIAPDYIILEESIQKDFINHLKEAIREFYGNDPSLSPDYGKIISEKHFDRLINLAESSGLPERNIQKDKQKKYLAPTIISDCTWNTPIMKEEIFGPLLPIIPVKNLQDSVVRLQKMPPPLALYFFGNNPELEREFVTKVRFGGGCINDTMVHLSNSHLPFGGVKESGMGRYHGEKSFETFTYQKSIMKKPFWPDIPLRYPPLKSKISWIKRLLS